jgi:translation initiation factor IF-1
MDPVIQPHNSVLTVKLVSGKEETSRVLGKSNLRVGMVQGVFLTLSMCTAADVGIL